MIFINLNEKLDKVYKDFFSSDKIKHIKEEYLNKYSPSKTEADLLIRNKLKPEIEIVKENINKLDTLIKEKQTLININSNSENFIDNNIELLDDLYKEVDRLSKERLLWNKSLDSLKLDRTMLFSGDYKKRFTEPQKELASKLENSVIAKEVTKAFISFLKESNEYNDILSELDLIKDSKDLLKFSTEFIVRYAKDDHEIDGITLLNSKIVLFNTIAQLIENSNNKNGELLEIGNTLKETIKTTLLSGYFFKDNMNLAVILRDQINKIYSIIETNKDQEDIKLLEKILEDVNAKGLLSDLNKEINLDMGDMSKQYEDERKERKKFLIEVGVKNGNFINKSIILNNIIYGKIPADKNDLQYLKESVLILYVYIRTFSLESFAPLCLYTI